MHSRSVVPQTAGPGRNVCDRDRPIAPVRDLQPTLEDGCAVETGVDRKPQRVLYEQEESPPASLPEHNPPLLEEGL